MASINIHSVRHDISGLSVRLNRFETFCTVEINAGEDSVSVFLPHEHADAAKVVVDLINDNLDRLVAKTVPV